MPKLKYKNLTPHAIHLPHDITIEPSGTIARCEEITMAGGVFSKIELISRKYGETIDLPSEEPYMIFIVSGMVRIANPERFDLASPGDLIRDDDGQIIGCKNLIVNDVHSLV